MVKKKERKEVLYGRTQRIKGGCGNIYAIINDDEDDKVPCECFLRLGKSGGCAAAFTEAIGRTISLGLSAGVPISDFRDQLLGISCHRPHMEIKSCPDGIGQIFKTFEDAVAKEKKPDDVKKKSEDKEDKESKSKAT